MNYLNIMTNTAALQRKYNCSYILEVSMCFVLRLRKCILYLIKSLTLWSQSSSKYYLRIQSVPQKEHFTITEINWLKPFKTIITDEIETHMK
jgi:hypothetical protein